MKRGKILFLVLALTLFLSSLIFIGASATDEDAGASAPYEYVVVLGVDGMGNFNQKTDTPNLDAIFEGGATTNYALVENPSASAQGWGSLLIGVPADVHGLTNYTIQEGAYSNAALPTIFKILKEQDPDAKMVSFCSWNSINMGIIEDIDGLVKEKVGDYAMGTAVGNYVAQNGAPKLLFCQFNNSDAVGHNNGYSSEAHLEYITTNDGYIGEIYDVYKNAGILDKTLFIVTSDHGGTHSVAADGTSSGTHGGWSNEEKYVFYGVAGKGVNETNELDMFIRDTPAIICYALGLKGTERWDSYVPQNLFVNNMTPLKRPASAPSIVCPNTTPEADDDSYIGNFIDINDLSAGFFFDGDLSNFVPGSEVELGRYVGDFNEKATGTIYYPQGLYSDAVRLSYEGYLATDDLKLDNSSFSIGLWLYLDKMTSDQPVWSTKVWSNVGGIAGSDQQGLIVRNYYKEDNAYLGFSFGSGPYTVGGVDKSATHANYNYSDANKYEPKEWVHVLLVMDRDTGIAKYYVNFEIAKTLNLSGYEWFTDDFDIDPYDVLAIGQDATGLYSRSLEGSIDDLLIWNKAIDADTIASLHEYYKDALYDYDYSIGEEPSISTTDTTEVAISNGVTNTDGTSFTKMEATVLGAPLSSTAKYQIAKNYTLADYDNPTFYIIDFDISTASSYLPMNFVSVIAGDKGTSYLESACNRITEDGILVGTLNGFTVERTLSTRPYDWQHITMVYDLVGGEDGYPLYIYLDGELISNAEWIKASAKENGEVPTSISSTRLMVEQFSTSIDHYSTTLIANATSSLYADDVYGNLDAFFSSGASMLESNKIFDLAYGKDYVLPTADYMFISNGVSYREFEDALTKGNGTVELLHDDHLTKYTITTLCTVKTNGYAFNFTTTEAVRASVSVDESGNKVYAFVTNEPLYKVTDKDENVTYYYEITSLDTLIEQSSSGSTVTLYRDIDILTKATISKNIIVDLNGHTVTNSAGYIRVSNNYSVTFKNGTIDDSESLDFVYIGYSAPNASYTLENCTIYGRKEFAEFRSGTFTMIKCKYTHVNNSYRMCNFASSTKANDTTTLIIDGCTIDLAAAPLVYHNLSTTERVDLEVSINNSTVTTTGSLFNINTPAAIAENSEMDITIKGNSKISCTTFDCGTSTANNSTLTLGLGAKFSLSPSINGATIKYCDGADGIYASNDTDYPYDIFSDDVLYTITAPNGSITAIFEEKKVQELFDMIPQSDKFYTITLYAEKLYVGDTSMATNWYASAEKKAININLNGKTLENVLSSNGRIRPDGGTINIYNGKIVDTATTDIIFGTGITSSMTFTNCEMLGNKFMDVRAGKYTFINCTYAQGGTSNQRFAMLGSASTDENLTLEVINCTFNLSSGQFVSTTRGSTYTAAAKINVIVDGTTITTTGALFNIENKVSYQSSSNRITIKGNSKISCGTFDTATVYDDNGNIIYKPQDTVLILGLGAKFSVNPSFTVGTIEFTDGAKSIATTDDEAHPYVITDVIISDDYLYTITDASGNVTKYYDVMSLQALLKETESKPASTITLYTDVDLSDTAAYYLYHKVSINLNGFTVTNTGERIRPSTNGHLIIYGGKIRDTAAKDFIFIGAGIQNAVVEIDNCDIVGNGYIIDARSGSVTVTNSTYTQGTDREGQFAYIMSSGSSASLTVENCTINMGTSAFVRIKRTDSRYATEAKATLTVKNSTIKTSNVLLDLQNTVSAESSSNNISFTGETYLTFATFDGGTCTVNNTTVAFGVGVKLSALPTVAAGSITFTDNGKAFEQTGDAEYPYEVINGILAYTITKSDKSVINVYGEKSFNDLVALADSESIIKLYANLECTAEITIENKNIEIDLNGYSIKSNFRIRPTGTTALYIHDGDIIDGSTDFVFISPNNSQAVFKMEDCVITLNGRLVDARSGSIILINSTINGKTSAPFLLSSAGEGASLYAKNSTFNLGSGNLASTNRGNYTTATHTDITIHNCTATTTGSLFYLLNNASGNISSIRISITGQNTKLSFATFDGESCNVPDTVVTLGVGVMMNRLPSLTSGKIVLGDGAKGIAPSDDSTYAFIVSESTYLTVKPYFSLTLYTDFTLNLCFRASDKDSIVKVTYGGVEITPFVENGMIFYPIKGIAAYNAAETKKINVTYLYQTIELDTVLEYSVIDYANGLFASDYSVESKEMIARAVDYIRAAYVYANLDIPENVESIIASESYKAISTAENVKEIPSSTTNVGKINEVIASARISLDTDLKFRFNLVAGVNATLNIKTATIDETYEIVDGKINGKNYIDIPFRAFNMYNGVITMTCGDNVGTYDLKAYANSDSVTSLNSEVLNALLLSLYNYCREAYEYACVSAKDFAPQGTVVVKDGKAGTVTYVIDDGRVDTAQRAATLIETYKGLKFTFALIPANYADLQTKYNDELGKYEYVVDEDGNYVYTIKSSQQINIDFWRDLIENSNGTVEYSNHTLTHGFWGLNDEGGIFTYVDNDGNILASSDMPIGSTTAQIYAAAQILNELFGVDIKTFVEAGIGVSTVDVEIDGVTYATFYTYYRELLMQALINGDIIGARRATFGATSVGMDKIITPEALRNLETRISIPALSVKDTNDTSYWKKHIDNAMSVGGWAVFCIHNIVPEGTEMTAHHIFIDQANELFSYSHSKDVWIANYTEATKYYTEWSTASVSTSFDGENITVILTDLENDELFDEALTVKVTVPSSWNACTAAGEDLRVMVDENGESYVYVDIVPDRGAVIISEK